MKKVSIIIPCYNVEKYIGKCLEKLDYQTYKNFSVICVDDASTDNTVKIINECKKKVFYDISIICCEENKGPANARNIGIYNSDSEYITFCDADDWYDESFLDLMINALEKNSADLVFCGYSIVNRNGKIKKRYLKSQSTVLLPQEALALDVDSLCMMLVKSEIMKKISIPNIRNGEDMAIVPLIITESKICAVVREPIYNYYRRIGSASQQPTSKVIDTLVFAYEYICQHILNDKYIEEIEFLGIKNLLYAGVIGVFTYTSDKEKAVKLINNFEKNHPNWRTNKKIRGLPLYKRATLYLISKRYFRLLRFVAIIRKHL